MNNQDITTSSQTPRSTGRRRGAIGLAGGLLAGTAAGLVFGVPGLSSAASSDSMTSAAVVQQADESESSTTGMPEQEPGEHLRETLQALVDDGTLTEEQADAVAAHLVENRPERGEGRHGGPGHPGGPFGGPASDALTELLGLDADELRTQLREGVTLAEIATEQGVDVQTVVDTLVAELEERVDTAVENGRIDQAEADEKLAEAEARITDMVNNGRPD
jgi:uncharacterized protein YidB (DUF937 family)